jgi:uncharacterized protein YggE
MKIIKITIAALLVLAAVALAGIGRPEAADGASENTRQGITVTGTGEVRSAPNRADLSFSIHSEGTTAAAALAANSAELRRLIAALKGAGVESSSLRTEHLGVSPRYDDGKVGTNGYSADSYLTVTDQGLERAGRLIDVGVSAGADSASGPALSIEDRDSQYRQALKLAVDDARAKAETLGAGREAADRAGNRRGHGSGDRGVRNQLAACLGRGRNAASPVATGASCSGSVQLSAVGRRRRRHAYDTPKKAAAA